MEFKSDIDVELIQSVGSDEIIARAAWASTKSDKSGDPLAVRGLINYLIKHRHGTPFEQNLMTFRIRAPIFVWREWHRHRIGFSYNEESGRYVTLEPVFYIPPIDRPMMKVDDWKPGRPKFLVNEDEIVYDELLGNLKHSYDVAYNNYLANLQLGIDPGLARDCLPVGIYSTCWVSCNARSMMSFLSLRTSDAGKSYPLFEIEMVAHQIEEHFKKLFPITWEAFCKNGRDI